MAIKIPETFDPNDSVYQAGNQPEIFSQDQYSKINRGNYLKSEILAFCRDRKLGFCWIAGIDNLDTIFQKHTITIFFGLYDLIPPFSFWKTYENKCQLLGKKIIVITDNYIDPDSISDEFRNIEFYSRPELLGVTSFYYDTIWPEIKPTKLYNCFIQRVDSVRQSWLYFLYNENLLDLGHISFLLRQYDEYFPDSIPIPQKALFEYIHKKYQLYKIPKFDRAFKNLRDKVPIRTFPEVNDLLPTILDTKYSLVLETFATEDTMDRWSLTEKLMRSIQIPRITLFFAQKHSGQILEKLGFEIQPQMLSIDDLSWHARQQSIIDILKNDTIKLDNRIAEMAAHNRDILKFWESKILEPDYFDDIWHQSGINH